MTMLDTIREAQTRSIEQIKTAQEQVISYNERIADTIVGAMPAFEAPFGEYLPTPAEVVDAYYSFVGELYAANRDFATRMVTAWDNKPAEEPKPVAKKSK
ncbi:MAG: hypothetical protein ACK5PP_07270 [Acidimicrobiales bacterium]